MAAEGAHEAISGGLPPQISAADDGGAAEQRCPAISVWRGAAAYLQELPCCWKQGEAATASARSFLHMRKALPQPLHLRWSLHQSMRLSSSLLPQQAELSDADREALRACRAAGGAS